MFTVWINMDPVKDANMNLSISPSTGDDTTWDIIRGWLDTCLQTHDRCNQRPQESFVPSRLLQLDTATGPEPVFRVVEATEVEPGTRYVTLSHCCGVDGLELTHSSLDQLLTPQPLSNLPLAFRDALTVVARLGLSHLWIDRLCLMQDDPSEQQAEASQTRDVFRNAFLSIAASGITSSSSGLFTTRDPALVAPTVFGFPVDAAGTTIPHYSWLEAPRGWTRAFRDDPLSRSAHAVQERLLAPRVVHFGSRMVFWECHGASCAEVHPHGVNEALGPLTGPERDVQGNDDRDIQTQNKPWKTLLEAPAWEMRHDPVHQVFSDWFIILETYSDCEPTVPKERLLGLAGVAKEMKNLLQERGCEETEYLAGMWKAMLPGGLVWNMRGSGRRPAAYRAPSWSWAAVDGGVNFHDSTPEEARRHLLYELVSATTTPCIADETGEVAAGSIVLRGKLALAKLHPPDASQCLPRHEDMLIKSLVKVEDDPGLAVPVPNSNLQSTVDFDTKEDMTDEVLCLPVRASTLSNIGCHVDGLALSLLDKDCYARCGYWSILANTKEEALGMFKGISERELEIV